MWVHGKPVRDNVNHGKVFSLPTGEANNALDSLICHLAVFTKRKKNVLYIFLISVYMFDYLSDG